MDDELESIRRVLLEGISKSKQGSYHRRSPASEAIPLLNKACVSLRMFIESNYDSAEAWRLLSLAEECLLHYDRARESLEKAIALESSQNRKDLKRLAMLREESQWWDGFPLSPVDLHDLKQFLIAEGAGDESKGRTLDGTYKWMQEKGVLSPEDVIDALFQKGARTDFQVLYNIARG